MTVPLTTYHQVILKILISSMFVVLLQTLGHGQKNKVVENGAIFYLNDGSKIVGKLVGTEGSSWIWQTKIATNDTLKIVPSILKRSYLPNRIALFENGRYHFKKGLMLNISNGFARMHHHFDVSLNQRIKNIFEIGVGMGSHNNGFEFSTESSHHEIWVPSVPLFVQGKYFLNERAKRLYVRAKLGYVNNVEGWGLRSVTNGKLYDLALGITFASRKRTKHYIELSQHSSSAKGMAINQEANAISDIGFDTRFNKIAFTWGIEIGR